MFAMNVILKHVRVVVLNLTFCSIYAVLLQIFFCRDLRAFSGKIFDPKNSGRVSFLTNIMSGSCNTLGKVLSNQEMLLRKYMKYILYIQRISN